MSMKLWIRLRVEGLNIDRQFARMTGSGVAVRDVDRKGHKTLEMSVIKSQKSNAVAFFPPECYNVTVIGEVGFAAALSAVKKRAVLAALCALFTVCVFVMGGYVWRVDIDAGDNTAAVVSLLRQNGLWIGAAKSGIDLDAAENLICNGLPGVKYAVVSLKGSTLTVKTYAKETPAPQIDLNEPGSVYAAADGVITRMVVVSGTPRVSVGDEVKKGQLLIEGVRTFADGSVEPTRAVGEVYADVTATGSAVFDEYVTRFVKTGECKVRRGVSFLGYDGTKTPALYEHQIAESQSVTLFPLPITITVTRIYRAESVTEKLNFDDFRDEIREKALAAALMACGAESGSVVYGEIRNGGTVTVTAEVTARRAIGVYAVNR